MGVNTNPFGFFLFLASVNIFSVYANFKSKVTHMVAAVLAVGLTYSTLAELQYEIPGFFDFDGGYIESGQHAIDAMTHV